MKIKEVCERTGLTERTVRFYQQKGLLTPHTYEQNLKTYYDYSEKDIQRLEEVAMLRRCGFSIEELFLIRDGDVEALPEICRKHLSALREENSRQQFQLQVMEQLEYKTFSSKQDFMNSVASAFRSQQTTPPPIPAGDVMPDFSKFDTETPEEKQEGYLDYLITQRKQEKRQESSAPCISRPNVLIFLGIPNGSLQQLPRWSQSLSFPAFRDLFPGRWKAFCLRRTPTTAKPSASPLRAR